MVQYCSAACQKAHRPQHKRVCKKRAAEIFDEALFKQPPLNEDCPICFFASSLHLIPERNISHVAERKFVVGARMQLRKTGR